MTEHAGQQLLEVEQRPNVLIVRFKRRTILEPTAIQRIGSELLALCGQEGNRTVVLNFAGVESMTSAMIGEFVLLHRTLSEAGGQLLFCNVDAFLLHVFKVVQIPERIPIYADEAQALQTLASQPK